MQGAITRLSSRNHKIAFDVNEDKTQAHVKLSEALDRQKVPHRDFILYIRDSSINKPVGFESVSADN
jgi:hypothetical protein